MVVMTCFVPSMRRAVASRYLVSTCVTRPASIGRTRQFVTVGKHRALHPLPALPHGVRWINIGDQCTGKMKVWNEEKGFGFIAPKGGGEDLFVHRSSIVEGVEVVSGEDVSYTIGWNDKRQKYRAADVQPMPDSHENARSSKISSHDVRSDHQPSSSEAPHQSSGSQAPLLQKLKQQALEMQNQSVSQPMSGDASGVVSSQQGTSFPQFPQLQLQVEPLKMPAGLPVDDRLELMMNQMEQLRLQGAQNQQLMLQSMYAMWQQQAAQNASLERALLAIADRIGGSPTSASRSSDAPTSSKKEELSDSSSRVADSTADDVRENKRVAREEEDSRKRADERKASEAAERKASEAAEADHHRVDEERRLKRIEEDGRKRADERKAREAAEAETQKAEQEKRLKRIEEEKRIEESKKEEKPKPEPSRSTAKKHSWNADSFHIVGSFTDWNIQEESMNLVDGYRFGIRRDAPRSDSGNLRREEFQIVGDRTWDKRVYPAGSDNEEIIQLRPGQPSQAGREEGKGHGRNWAIDARPGAQFLLTFDPETSMISVKPTR